MKRNKDFFLCLAQEYQNIFRMFAVMDPSASYSKITAQSEEQQNCIIREGQRNISLYVPLS